MKLKTGLALAFLLTMTVTATFASDPKLEGAYKFVSLKFQGGEQTEADAKGMVVVHGKYLAYVRSGVKRQAWNQNDPEDARMKKIIAAFQGLNATAGTFEIEGDTIILNQVAQSVPSSMGATTRWKFKLDGNKLMLKPAENPNVEFTFERLP